jgi:hypothetical protein
MKMIWDPPPALDPIVPEVQAAVDRIRIELQLVKLEQPSWTPFEQLREARRRCAKAMVDAVDGCEGRCARRRS